nr:MAG TPA: hypothetical protein [Caudoviricetes sp.]
MQVCSFIKIPEKKVKNLNIRKSQVSSLNFRKYFFVNKNPRNCSGDWFVVCIWSRLT